MSNILKVTTPISGFDNANHVKTGPVKTTDPAIQAPITPDKVSKPDARSDSAPQDNGVGLKFRYDSNFENFVQQTKMLPNMTEEFSKLFFQKFGSIVESGVGNNFAEQIAQFFEMIGMGEADVLNYVQNQANASLKFTGSFFTLLNQVLENTTSVELKTGILDFLRRYTDMSESSHLMNTASDLLNQIDKNLLQSSKEGFHTLLTKLNYNIGSRGEGMAENITVFKGEILPFLNNYITRNNNRGNLRDLTAALATLMARCENGSADRVVMAFENLMKYQAMQQEFKNFDTSVLLQVLEGTDYKKTANQQEWADSMIELIRNGASGEAGLENKMVFRNLMQSILLNESVYMPVLHLMLPLQVGERLMFSEMWIDPDAEGNKDKNGKEKTLQGLIKFDIQEVGFFDLYFLYTNESIKLQLNCPEELEKDIGIIRDEISRILALNNIKTDELFIETDKRSIPISTAFPQIFERKNSVNVSI